MPLKPTDNLLVNVVTPEEMRGTKLSSCRNLVQIRVRSAIAMVRIEGPVNRSSRQGPCAIIPVPPLQNLSIPLPFVVRDRSPHWIMLFSGLVKGSCGWLNDVLKSLRPVLHGGVRVEDLI